MSENNTTVEALGALTIEKLRDAPIDKQIEQGVAMDLLENFTINLWLLRQPNVERFEWSPRPDDFDLGEAKECFANSARYVVGFGEGRTDVQYYEGLMQSPDASFPVLHAWLVRDGRVIDVTLPNPDETDCRYCDFFEGTCEICNDTKHFAHNVEGAVYLGVPIDHAEVQARALREGAWVANLTFILAEETP